MTEKRTILTSHDQKTSDIWIAIAIGVLTFLVFSPVLGHRLLDAWDDNIAIMQNPDYNPPRISALLHYWVPPPREEFYVPVQYTLWGLVAMAARSPATGQFNPAAFHALNLTAHALSAAMAFLVLRRLVASRWAAATGALIFALHPIQTEAVAWAASAYTPLSGMLSLAAVWQFLKYVDESDAGRRRTATWHYGLACAAFLAAMLTKPSAVSTPLIAAALAMGFRNWPARKLFVPLGAWVLVSIPLIVATRHGTPAATVGNFEPWQRIVVALDAMGFYLYKIFWPARLGPDYGRSPGWLLGRPAVWVIGLIPVGLFVMVRLMRKRAPWLNGAAAVFAAALLPTLGLSPFNFQTFSTVADRYAYLAMFAVAIVFAVMLSHVRGRVAAVIAAILLPALAAMSIVQLSHWKNGWRLFDYTLASNPNSHIVSAQIRFMFSPAIEAECDLPPGAIAAMGDRLMRQKRSALAANLYRMAIERGSPDPATRYKLAIALIQNEQPGEASRTLRQWLEQNPKDAEAHALMGDVLTRSDVEAAGKEYRQALRLDSENATARRGLSLLRPSTQPG